MPQTAHLTPFTSETGKQAQLKSARVLRELVENGKKYLTLTLERTTAQTEVASEVARQIELTETQLTYAHNRLMAGDVPDKEAAALMRESRGHMAHLCRLRGIGEPARTRPANEPRATARARSEPVALPQATISSVQPSAPSDNKANPA